MNAMQLGKKHLGTRNCYVFDLSLKLEKFFFLIYFIKVAETLSIKGNKSAIWSFLITIKMFGQLSSHICYCLMAGCDKSRTHTGAASGGKCQVWQP